MASGVSKELEVLIRSKLRDLVNGEPGSIAFIDFSTDPLEADAISYLADIGAFERVGTGSFRVTAQGRDYWDQLNAPRWYWFRRNWFRRNWFAASVAGATIVAALAQQVPTSPTWRCKDSLQAVDLRNHLKVTSTPD